MARELKIARGPFELRGPNLEFFRYQGPESVLSGPAGTGKSLTCLLRLHYICSHVPGVRALIVRKTRESLTESALVTFEQEVVPADHPILASGGQRRLRQSYRYPNGSEIVVGGLDKPGKIMSTQYDLAYVQEAIELREEDWDALSSRMRHGRLSYQQVFGDTNPDAPGHWLYQRCQSGRCWMAHSRHQDNPRWHDGTNWTPEGLTYLARLGALTGPRHDRLGKGLWVQAEGVVYDDWRPHLHLIDRRQSVFHGPDDPPYEWPRRWAIDFGYTHPFVCLLAAIDPDGRAYIYRQVYHTRRLVEDHAARLLHLLREETTRQQRWALKRALDRGTLPPEGPARDQALADLARTVEASLRPRRVLCDHDAEDRATLERHLGMKTVAAFKAISPGIQAVAARLRSAGDGKPRLYVLRDGLDQRDASLRQAGRPTCLEDEVLSYVWDTRGHRRRGELPVDEDNHALDALRYLVADLDLVPSTVRVRC